MGSEKVHVVVLITLLVLTFYAKHYYAVSKIDELAIQYYDNNTLIIGNKVFNLNEQPMFIFFSYDSSKAIYGIVRANRTLSFRNISNGYIFTNDVSFSVYRTNDGIQIKTIPTLIHNARENVYLTNLFYGSSFVYTLLLLIFILPSIMKIFGYTTPTKKLVLQIVEWLIIVTNIVLLSLILYKFLPLFYGPLISFILTFAMVFIYTLSIRLSYR